MPKYDPPRIRPVPSPDSLANVALQYLARFAASEAALRRVLQNRIRRAGLQHPDFAADPDRQAKLSAAIETIIDRHRASGALNDAAYAEIKVRGLRGRGRSRRMIAQKLMSQGVDSTIVGDALVAFDDGNEPEAAEFSAAQSLARRRKLGPYRTADLNDDGARRKATQKDFAALARAGFSMGVIRRVLGGEASDMGDGADDDWN
jgi:regulatory protein